MFIRIINGVPEAYTVRDLCRDNPQTSFPKDVPSDMLAAYGVYPVRRVSAPPYNELTQSIRLLTPAQIEEQWTQQWEVVELPESMASENISDARNRLLQKTDWMALSDNTMTPEWASYRQALRDITSQEGFPYSVIWPNKPE